MTVKKLVSLSPVRYEEIEIGHALIRYASYIQSIAIIETEPKMYGHGKTEPEDIKSFTEWLETEI